jgi:hypothetical protein
MSVPLRKDELETEELTTADLAQGKRPAASGERPTANLLQEDRPGPVLAERPSAEGTPNSRRENTSEVRNADLRSTEARAAEDRATEERGTAAQNAGSSNAAETATLFPNNELEELRNRWSGVQTAFVDEPRRAVEQADGLVASTMKRLAEVFAEERSKLEKQWDRGDNVSTEDLRIALQRYRAFFQRLLSI